MSLKTSHEELPEHLGGHNYVTWHDEGALDYFIKNFKIKSLLDIGCGPGAQTELAREKGIFSVGIDGDYTLKRNTNTMFQIHDYCKGPLSLNDIKYRPNDEYFDLGWCIEFLEHVEEKYIPNFMETFKACKIVVVTHAFPGQGGHHHVNEQEKSYWVDVFRKYGFKHSEKILSELLQNTTMRRKRRKNRFTRVKENKNWLELNGSVFLNRNI